jgi:hypothetical protein
MSAVLGTLPFLATLWLLVVLGAMVLEESGAKIAAALKGKPPRHPAVECRSIRIRMRPQSAAICSEPLRRAAA